MVIGKIRIKEIWKNWEEIEREIEEDKRRGIGEGTKKGNRSEKWGEGNGNNDNEERRGNFA